MFNNKGRRRKFHSNSNRPFRRRHNGEGRRSNSPNAIMNGQFRQNTFKGPYNAAKLIEELDPVDSVSMGDDVILATLKEGVDDYSEIASHVISAGFKIVMFREEEINLESAFMTLTRGVGKKI